MIAKVFKQYSYASVAISGLLLSLISYNYSNLTATWFSFQAKSLNFFLILAILAITIRAIDKILNARSSNGVRFWNIEITPSYHLLIYPLIVLSFPTESFDLRLLLCPALWITGWACFLQYLENRNTISGKKSMLFLFDTVLLVSIASILFIEHLFLLPMLVICLVFSTKSITSRELGVFILIPILLFFTTYTIFLLFDVDALLFSPISSLKNLSFSNPPNLSFIYYNPSLLYIFFLFICSFPLIYRLKASYEIKMLNYAGLFVFGILLTTIAFVNPLSGIELHYLSLPLTSSVYALLIFTKSQKFHNFLFISLIINVLLFTFVLN